jgi:hypothetical protein
LPHSFIFILTSSIFYEILQSLEWLVSPIKIIIMLPLYKITANKRSLFLIVLLAFHISFIWVVAYFPKILLKQGTQTLQHRVSHASMELSSPGKHIMCLTILLLRQSYHAFSMHILIHIYCTCAPLVHSHINHIHSSNFILYQSFFMRIYSYSHD